MSIKNTLAVSKTTPVFFSFEKNYLRIHKCVDFEYIAFEKIREAVYDDFPQIAIFFFRLSIDIVLFNKNQPSFQQKHLSEKIKHFGNRQKEYNPTATTVFKIQLLIPKPLKMLITSHPLHDHNMCEPAGHQLGLVVVEKVSGTKRNLVLNHHKAWILFFIKQKLVTVVTLAFVSL